VTRPTLRRALAVVLTSGLVAVPVVLVLGGTASAQTPEPYRDPPFTCDLYDYGTDAPPIPGPADDPLCVRYDKTNVTVSTLEAVDFLAAEPGRVTIVAGKCSFWQQDEWAIRASPETPVLVSWSGSYWYDAVTGSAGGVLRDLEVAEQPASADAFIEAMRPLVGDEQADDFARFTDEGGGGGLTMSLPDGFGYEACRAGDGEPEQPTDETPPADDTDPSGDSSPGQDTAGTARTAALPATGSTNPIAPAIVLAGAALLLRNRWTRRAN